MFFTALVLGIKYGPPLVAAIFSVLAHNKGRQNNKAIAEVTKIVKAGPPPARG
jgi:hypothetical protein